MEVAVGMELGEEGKTHKNCTSPMNSPTRRTSSAAAGWAERSTPVGEPSQTPPPAPPPLGGFVAFAVDAEATIVEFLGGILVESIERAMDEV